MARAAKKEQTMEEKLAQALVSEEQQPYPVPGNWCWAKIGALSTFHRGVSYKKNDAHSEKQLHDCLIMRGGNIGEGCIDVAADNVYVDMRFVNEEQFVRKNDIIIVASTGSKKVIGRAGISLNDYSDVAFGAFLMAVRPSKKANPVYMGYYFQGDLYRNRIRHLASGTNINNIRAEHIAECPIPFPPLAEQSRIVNIIERLFADLDKAKEKLQSVMEGFAVRRMAILHRAFTGDLTAKWREENNVDFESWEKRTLGKCGNWSGGGTPSMKQPEYWDNANIRWVTSKDMKAETICETQMRINSAGVQNSSAKLTEGPALLFVTRSGILRRTFPVAMIYGKFTVNQDIKVLKPFDNISAAYLLRACQASNKKILQDCMKSGTTVESVNFPALKNFSIPLCPLSEQQEIVRILDETFEKERQAQSKVASALEGIELIKKSILARAFRGELGTNDSDDESGEELLRRVLS